MAFTMQWEAAAPYDSALHEQVKAELSEPLRAALHTSGKFERRAAVTAVIDPYVERIPVEEEEKRSQIKKIVKALEEELLREAVLKSRKRFDGRALAEIRPITIEVGPLPRTHGSALFTRGETQSLVSATLGSEGRSGRR